MNNKNNLSGFLYWYVGFLSILSIISICLSIEDIVITNESLVISFIGLLTAFIVIGNYSQVSETRKNFEIQIEINKKQTFQYIDDELTKTNRRVGEVEERAFFNSAEGYRLYAKMALEKSKFRLSTAYYIHSAYYYYSANHPFSDRRILSILDIIDENLIEEKWSDASQGLDFMYDENLDKLNKLPDYYDKKLPIKTKLMEFKKKAATNIS